MKIKYTFSVEGVLPIGRTKILEKDASIYEFRSGEDGFVAELIVTKRINGSYRLPTITPAKSDDVPMHINIEGNGLDLTTIHDVKALQNILSFFGLHRIDTKYFNTEWIPENEEERSKVRLFSFKPSRASLEAGTEVVPLELIATCVAASESLLKQEVLIPMSFYRKGREDFYGENYLDACYDFYFMLETLFADGKFKTLGVKEAFSKSEILQSAISRTITNLQFSTPLKFKYPMKYKEVIEGKSVLDISNWLVDFRGDIHHHSLKTNRWNPDSYDNFKFEADLMQYIAHNVANDLTAREIFSKNFDLNNFFAKELS
jgi:hypothetical protein